MWMRPIGFKFTRMMFRKGYKKRNNVRNRITRYYLFKWLTGIFGVGGWKPLKNNGGK